jgi:succinate dehydrogenase / fumarate reductase cytochrome b subunit
LSIANRITGIGLTVCAVVLVAWLAAAASGREAYDRFQHLIGSWPGLLLLLAATFTLFLHLLGGIRHLIWDSVRAFELKQIYASGWIVIALSVALTLAAWLAGVTVMGRGG